MECKRAEVPGRDPRFPLTALSPFLVLPSTHPATVLDPLHNDTDDDDDHSYPPLDDPSSAAMTARRPRPSFPIPIRPANAHSAGSTASMSISPEDRLQMQLNQSTFKGPQHKHAHHLHSIPPREKTTRTLILDHLLWQLARARFSQARAELGMNTNSLADDNEDDADSYVLGGGSGAGGPPTASDPECVDWSDPAREKDTVNARAFKARADGLEKVLSAMIDQPPEELPFDADDLLFRDTSFAAPAAPQLPNGVRLRLALAGLINDIFAEDDCTVGRHPPPVEFAPFHYHSPTPPLTAYTPALSQLALFSSYAHHSEKPVLPSFHALAATADPSTSDAPPAQSILPPPNPPKGSIFSSIPRGAGPESPWALGGSHRPSTVQQPGASASSSSMPPPPPPGSSSARASSSSGARFASASSSSDLRAPPPPRVFRAVGRSRDLYNAGTYARPGPPPHHPHHHHPYPLSQRPYRCPHHLTYTCPPSSFCVASAALNSAAKKSPLASKSRTQSSIGAGLSKCGPPLRRNPLSGRNGGKDARMTDLIPRFLRLSALVAVELGREARGEDERAEAVSKVGLAPPGGGATAFSSMRPRAGSSNSTRSSTYESDAGDEPGVLKRSRVVAARPTKLWYALLAGLLTRAALQGYLVKGWKGTDPVEVLLGLGIGPPPAQPADPPHKPARQGDRMGQQQQQQPAFDDDEDALEDDDEEMDREFEPDDMPDLSDMWHVLFGAKPKDGSASASALGREAFEDYEQLMGERISEFFTIPPHCSDLSTHFDDLAHKYPSQPVDYAVLRFCEAVNKWRGRPELENYKNRPSQPPTPTAATPSTSLSIHSLIHPQPPARPPIEKYFTIPTKAEREALLAAWDRERAGSTQRPRGNSTSSTLGAKRTRRNSWTESKGKKVAVSAGQAWMEDDEYVGPYGI